MVRKNLERQKMFLAMYCCTGIASKIEKVNEITLLLHFHRYVAVLCAVFSLLKTIYFHFLYLYDLYQFRRKKCNQTGNERQFVQVGWTLVDCPTQLILYLYDKYERTKQGNLLGGLYSCFFLLSFLVPYYSKFN